MVERGRRLAERAAAVGGSSEARMLGDRRLGSDKTVLAGHARHSGRDMRCGEKRRREYAVAAGVEGVAAAAAAATAVEEGGGRE